MSAATSTCWIASKESAWELATLLSENGDGSVTVQTSDGEKKSISKSLMHRSDASHFNDFDDLCFMNHLHEAPLLDCLRRRFLQDKIYTTTGDVLLSVNPYKRIPGLYESVLTYLDLPSDGFLDPTASSPHVYKTANRALVELMHGKPGAAVDAPRNQSIVISGESGAGKTEASKHVMHFLIEADQESGVVHDVSAAEEQLGDKIKKVLMQSNYILEAFGNSKTVRNDNSSRFGKYIKLQYSSDNRLISAFTETFLLEKSRLMNISLNERNYHFFYQFLRKNQDKSLSSKLSLKDPAQFKMLIDAQGTAHPSDEDDNYELVLQALRTLGTSEAEITHILSLVAAILHLGNLTCTMLDESTSCSPTPPPRAAEGDQFNGVLGNAWIACPSIDLHRLTELLGLSPETFVSKLTTQKVKAGTRKSVSYKRLTQQEVMNNVAALIKWLYSSLFAWLVRKINYAHCSVNPNVNVKANRFIGILDIFGFEILQSNSFEQLCINFANERLQQQFNEFVFDREQVVYQSEGIDWTAISYRDNQHVIDLIGKKQSGLLALLEAQGMLNRGSADENALVSTFNQTHDKKNVAYEKSRFGNDGKFTIKHFAGNVTYLVTNFLEKNNDALQDDLMELMMFSQNEFIQNAIVSTTTMALLGDGSGLDAVASPASPKLGFIPELDPSKIVKSIPTVVPTSPVESSSSRVAAAGKKMASTATVSFQFRNQLDMLLSTLRATSPHYVKCLKPNTLKTKGIFDANMVLEQLKYSGALEVVRIRQEGYPICMDFQYFYQTFELLGRDQPLWQRSKNCTAAQAKEYSTAICTRSLQSKRDYALGHSKVFLRNDGFERMFAAVQQHLSKLLSKAQRIARGFLARRRFRSLRQAVVVLQSRQRTRLQQRLFAEALAEKKRKEAEAAAAAERERLRRLKEEEDERERQRIAAEEQKKARDLQARQEQEKQRVLEEQRRQQQQVLKEKEQKEQEQRKANTTAAATASAAATAKVQQEQPQVQTQKEVAPISSEKPKPQSSTVKSSISARIASVKANLLGTTTAQPDSKVMTSLSSSDTPQSRIHALCRAGDVSAVLSLLQSAPHLRECKDESRLHCSLLQSACISGNVDMFNALKPSVSELLHTRDDEGNAVAHYAAHCGISTCADLLRAIATVTDDVSAVGNVLVSKAECSPIDGAKRGDILLSGWLSKQSERSTWQRRFVVLTTHSLMYFRNEKDSIPRDSLDFDHTSLTVTRSWKKNAMDVFVSSKSTHKQRDRLTLLTSSETQLIQWMEMIQAVAGASLPPLRPTFAGNNSPLRTVNVDHRKQVFGLVNARSETLLHVLCRADEEILHSHGSAKLRTTNPAAVRTQRSGSHSQHHEWTAFDICDAVLWLVGSGCCSVDAVDALGKTALHLAVERRQGLVAQALLLAGADPSLPSARGDSPISLSVTIEFQAMLQSARNRYMLKEGLLSSPKPKLRGFHYLSIGLLYSTVSQSRFFVSPDKAARFVLQVSVQSPYKELLSSYEKLWKPSIELPHPLCVAKDEECSELDTVTRPSAAAQEENMQAKELLAQEQTQRWHWNGFFHLPLSLDHVEDNSIVTFELLSASNGTAMSSLASGRLILEKSNMNSETRSLPLLVDSRQGLVHSTLVVDFEIVCRR